MEDSLTVPCLLDFFARKTNSSASRVLLTKSRILQAESAYKGWSQLYQEDKHGQTTIRVRFHHLTLCLRLLFVLFFCAVLQSDHIRIARGAEYQYDLTRSAAGPESGKINSICLMGAISNFPISVPLDGSSVSFFRVPTIVVGNFKVLNREVGNSLRLFCYKNPNIKLVTRRQDGVATFADLQDLPSPVVNQTRFSASIMRAQRSTDTIVVRAQNGFPNRGLAVRGLGDSALLLGFPPTGQPPFVQTRQVPAENISFPVDVQDVGDYLDSFYTNSPLSSSTRATIILSWNSTSCSWIVSYVVHTQSRLFGIVGIMLQATFQMASGDSSSSPPSARKLLGLRDGRHLLQYFYETDYYSGGTDSTTMGCTLTKVLIYPRPSYCTVTYPTYPNCLYKWVCK